MEIAEIRGAVAKGWTYPLNEKKIMDIDLAEAISIEIEKLFINEKIAQLDSALQKARARAMADITTESPK